MNRKRAAMLALAFAAAVVAPTATPARADAPQTCSGALYMVMDGPWGYLPSSGTAFTTTGGWCGLAGPTSGMGRMLGSCGRATGYGHINGRTYEVRWAGDTMTFVGGANGTFVAVATPFARMDPRTNNMCATNDARVFQLVGSIVLL